MNELHEPNHMQRWKTPISSLRNLAHLDIHTRGAGNVLVGLEDLDVNERHVFWFSRVLGFRFEDSFNKGRLENTFIVTESTWIAEMRRKPFCTVDLSSAAHYEFSSLDGNFQIVAIENPLYLKYPSNQYAPDRLHKGDFGELPLTGGNST